MNRNKFLLRSTYGFPISRSVPCPQMLHGGGRGVGELDGSFVNSAGARVGIREGTTVGDKEGTFVGSTKGGDGTAVGELDGSLVGFRVGFLVGTRVGFRVGRRVGFLVGFRVGTVVDGDDDGRRVRTIGDGDGIRLAAGSGATVGLGVGTSRGIITTGLSVLRAGDDVGFRVGSADTGNKVGTCVGRAVVGINVGLCVGNTVGLNVGWLVIGWKVGADVGGNVAAVGDCVGFAVVGAVVGIRLGANVGKRVGTAVVGDDEGFADGIIVGEKDGESVGDSVGSNVGGKVPVVVLGDCDASTNGTDDGVDDVGVVEIITPIGICDSLGVTAIGEDDSRATLGESELPGVVALALGMAEIAGMAGWPVEVDVDDGAIDEDGTRDWLLAGADDVGDDETIGDCDRWTTVGTCDVVGTIDSVAVARTDGVADFDGDLDWASVVGSDVGLFEKEGLPDIITVVGFSDVVGASEVDNVGTAVGSADVVGAWDVVGETVGTADTVGDCDVVGSAERLGVEVGISDALGERESDGAKPEIRNDIFVPAGLISVIVIPVSIIFPPWYESVLGNTELPSPGPRDRPETNISPSSPQFRWFSKSNLPSACNKATL
jgi:hypothetical protein